MKKAITLAVVFFCIFINSFSQEVGYNTTDIGAEYQYYKEGNIYKLHFAFNSKLHHSFHVSVGYNSVTADLPPTVKKFHGGLAAGLGYRYYFAYRPHHAFIGIRADFISRKMEYYTIEPEKFPISRIMPAAELGYMFLINDMFFITPSVSLGTSVRTDTKFEADVLDKGLIFLPGISMGFKF